MNYKVILYPSSSYAIYGQKVLIRHSIESKLVPVPRLLSSNCGVCTRILNTEADQAEELLKQMSITYEGIHSIL